MSEGEKHSKRFGPMDEAAAGNAGSDLAFWRASESKRVLLRVSSFGSPGANPSVPDERFQGVSPDDGVSSNDQASPCWRQ